MTWNLKSDRPIYSQLLEQIQLKIVSGYYTSGSKLPSVRELASEASVNPNTMQKALSELERSGLIYSQRTTGRFITEDNTMITKSKNVIASDYIKEFFISMQNLGLQPMETLELIEEAVKEMTK